ncbi:MAG TPA: serine hydrolase [Longimicrobiales bacterium]|nr:serine hydrolase [Longimicrobiales bacterium]
MRTRATMPARRLWLLPAALMVATSCDSPTRPQAAGPDPAAETEAQAPRTGALAPTDRLTWQSPQELNFDTPLMQLAAIDAAAAHARLLDLMEGSQTGGTVGFYVREIGGPTHLAHNEDFVFEPASSIKALSHFHAMRQVQDGAIINGDVVTLDRQIPWFQGPANYSVNPGPGETSCPDLTDPTQGSLSFVLQRTMVNSDNRTTQATRDFFGADAIDATRIALGMNDSRHVHMIGCGALATADPNWFTLADAGRLYEAAATTYLDPPTRTAAFNLMPRSVALFDGIVDQEAVGLGLTAPRITLFKSGRDAALKPGSYGVGGLQYRSVAGWSSIPFRNAACQVDPRELVWGVFVHGADTFGGTGIGTLGAETLREHIRAGLETWADCQADLRVTEVAVLDMDDPLYVNQTESFVVRVTVNNAGSAPVVDATLQLTATAPADCTFDESPKSVPVNGLANGESRDVDFDFDVTCTQPSEHQFQFQALIQPQLPDMFDPTLANNLRNRIVTRELIAYADLGIVGWDFAELDAAMIGDLVLGQAFEFTTTQTLRNLGDTQLGLYHDPAETFISRSLTVPEGVRATITVAPAEAGASVTIQRDGQPDQVIHMVPALSQYSVDGAATIIVTSRRSINVNQTVELAGGWAIECQLPGEHTLVFDGGITAVDPHLLDPDESDNTMQVTRDIDCAVPVQINIRPANQFNWINPGSMEIIPVAVLTTAAGEYGLPVAFDATTIDPGMSRFGTVPVLNGGNGSSVHQSFIRDSFEMDDHTRDGDLDMVLHFRIAGTGATAATTELCVTGKFQGNGGTWFTYVGCDVVQTQGN